MAARIIPYNQSDIATLGSAQLLTSNLPLSNLQTQGRDTVTRFNSVTVSAITMSWATNQKVNGVSLAGTNFTGAATVQLVLFSDSAFTTAIYAPSAQIAMPLTDISGLIMDYNELEFQPFRNTAIYTPLFTNVKSAILYLTDSTNTAGYLQASRLCVGQYKEFKYQEMYSGASQKSMNSTQVERAKSGGLYVDKGAVWNRIEVKKEWMDEAADWADFQAIAARLGMDRDFFYSQYPGAGTFRELYHQGIFNFGDISPVDRWVYNLSRTSYSLEGQ